LLTAKAIHTATIGYLKNKQESSASLLASVAGVKWERSGTLEGGVECRAD